MQVDRRRILKLSTEFIVIVAGVLVALAADRWNQGRIDVEAETEYIARLEAEIRRDGLRAEAFLAAGPSISDANRALMGLVEQSEAPADLVGAIVAAFRELTMPAAGSGSTRLAARAASRHCGPLAETQSRQAALPAALPWRGTYDAGVKTRVRIVKGRDDPKWAATTPMSFPRASRAGLCRQRGALGSRGRHTDAINDLPVAERRGALVSRRIAPTRCDRD